MTDHSPSHHERPSTEPGIEAENFVVGVLLDWRLEKKPFLDGRRITRIIHSDKNDKCDREGVDLWVIMSHGQFSFPLQVKSSEKHDTKVRHIKAHPNVPYLIVAKLVDGAMEPEEMSKFERDLEDLVNMAIRASYPRRYREILKSLPPRPKSRRLRKKRRRS